MSPAPLVVSMTNDSEVTVSREFDAPCNLVFAALTQPALLKRWYGGEGWTLDVCEIDLVAGGRWRYVTRRPDGKAIGQYGEYREIEPDVRIVKTERWEDWDTGETLVTVTLAGDGDATLYTCHMRFPSQAVRDTVVRSGLERGAAQSYERLAQLLAQARANA